MITLTTISGSDLTVEVDQDGDVVFTVAAYGHPGEVLFYLTKSEVLKLSDALTGFIER